MGVVNKDTPLKKDRDFMPWQNQWRRDTADDLPVECNGVPDKHVTTVHSVAKCATQTCLRRFIGIENYSSTIRCKYIVTCAYWGRLCKVRGRREHVWNWKKKTRQPSFSSPQDWKGNVTRPGGFTSLKWDGVRSTAYSQLMWHPAQYERLCDYRF